MYKSNRNHYHIEIEITNSLMRPATVQCCKCVNFTIKFYKYAQCNNNNFLNIQSLSRVDVVWLFWSLIPVFPRIQTVAYVFHSQSNFIGSYFLYSPRRQAFLIDFICVFIDCSLGSSFRYSPVFKPFLVNFSF